MATRTAGKCVRARLPAAASPGMCTRGCHVLIPTPRTAPFAPDFLVKEVSSL